MEPPRLRAQSQKFLDQFRMLVLLICKKPLSAFRNKKGASVLICLARPKSVPRRSLEAHPMYPYAPCRLRICNERGRISTKLLIFLFIRPRWYITLHLHPMYSQNSYHLKFRNNYCWYIGVEIRSLSFTDAEAAGGVKGHAHCPNWPIAQYLFNTSRS
jgi:hypothetical protein